MFQKTTSWLLAIFCLNSACNAQKSEKIKISYLQYKSDYKSVRMYDDFFNPEHSDFLLKDKELLDFFANKIKFPDTKFSDVVIYEINKLKAEQTEITYVMLQKQGIKDIEAIINLPYGLDMMLILHYNYLHAPYQIEEYAATTQKYMRENAQLFFEFRPKVWEKVVNKALSKVSYLTKAQTETLLYLLLEFPLPLSQDNFDALVTHWSNFNPFFSKEIQLMQAQRKELAMQLANTPDTLKVDFSNTDKNFAEHKDWLRYIFALAGKKIVQGNDFQVEWLSQTTLLKEAEKVYTTKISTQKAARHWLVGATGVNPKMEITYYEKEFKGITPPIALQEFKVHVQQKDKSLIKFTTNEILTNQYFDKATGKFIQIPAEEQETQRTWLLGIALSYFTAEKKK